MRTGLRAVGLGIAGLCALSLGVAAHSPSLRASAHAGWRAFRDPSLLDPVAAPPPPPTIDCRRFTGDEARPREAELARDFERPTVDDDPEDPQGALAQLTLPDVRAPLTRRAMRYAHFFSKTEAGRAAFLTRFRRAGKYRDAIEHALREAGLPEDLVWLAAIESGFDPRAASRSGAAGLWQFMPDTGQLYGLDQSPWVDERRSLTRSTAAAVTHLRDLYERFHRWDLALAAYNAGYDRVVGAMDKVARERGPMRLDDKPIEFADLAAARALPEETSNYVPQILAFALVAQNLEHFGFETGNELSLAPTLDLGELAVPEGTRLRTVARSAGISTAQLREYNPQILRDRVPPTGGDYLIAVPADRIPHALATFPSYLDQEIVASNAPDDDALEIPAVPAGDGFDPDYEGSDDPLPRRPLPLGKNRLPAFALPGEQRVVLGASALLGDRALLAAKLPTVALGAGLGWQQPYREDPFGLLDRRGGASAAKAGESAIEKQLGFLSEPAPEALRSFTLANGITVRVRRDKGAPLTSITVRIAAEGAERAPVAGVSRAGGGEASASEELHTITVGKGDVDAGIELAASRVRVALGGGARAEIAELYRLAGEPRRKLLTTTPYGPSWIALGGALFPPGHPLAGTVIGASSEPAGARDLLLAEAMQGELARARASITVVGDVDEERARKLAEAFLGAVTPFAEEPVGPHPREERVTVEDAVPGPRLLYGWIAPAEGEVGDASIRVAIEILQNPKIARLRHALVDPGICAVAEAAIEPGPRAGVAAIELAPASGHELAEVERYLDAELERLADEGPTALEEAVAKVLLRARTQRELATVVAVGAGKVHSAPTAQLRHALHPERGDKLLAALDEVSPATIRAAVKRILTREHRVVITTVPSTRASLSILP